MTFEVGNSYYKDNRKDSWIVVSSVESDRIFGRQLITQTDYSHLGHKREKTLVLNNTQDNFWITHMHDWKLKPVEQKVEIPN